MLQRCSTTNNSTSSTTPPPLRRFVTGRSLAKNRWRPSFRASLAAAWFAGDLSIEAPTITLAASLFKVSPRQVSRHLNRSSGKRSDKVIIKIRSVRGLAVRVAEACDVTRMAVYQWQQVPIERVHVVASLIGMAPEEIRPDIFRPARSARP
jgi:hypothetical protein